MIQSPQAGWLLQSQAIDETRWQNVTQILCQLFKACAVAIVQYAEEESCILTLRQAKNVGLVRGSVENIDSLKSRLRNPNLPSDGLWQHGLIELPLYWPGGVRFGAVILVCDTLPANLESCQILASPMLELIQCELIIYRQAKQIEQMSLQDETTQMLNRNGFNLMAPRHLNLSRRLGSHAGLVVMESGVQFDDHIAEDKIKALSLVVYDNMREADLAARIDRQIVLLAFVDGQANLDSLVARLHKQFGRTLEDQRVLTGCCFFTPDSHLEFRPMLASARAELEQTRARLYPKPSDENNAAQKTDWLTETHDTLKRSQTSSADKPNLTAPVEATKDVTLEPLATSGTVPLTEPHYQAADMKATESVNAELDNNSSTSHSNRRSIGVSAKDSHSGAAINANDTSKLSLSAETENTTKKSRAKRTKGAASDAQTAKRTAKADTNKTGKTTAQVSKVASKSTKAKAAADKTTNSDETKKATKSRRSKTQAPD